MTVVVEVVAVVVVVRQLLFDVATFCGLASLLLVACGASERESHAEQQKNKKKRNTKINVCTVEAPS